MKRQKRHYFTSQYLFIVLVTFDIAKHMFYRLRQKSLGLTTQYPVHKSHGGAN